MDNQIKQVNCEISTKSISVETAVSFVQNGRHGACDIFIGKVRDHNLGKQVKGVSYDVFEQLAINTFKEIANEAAKKWGPDIAIYISHFKGRLDIGGVSVIIAVSTPHRDESFKACRYIIEEIKHRSPIWKQEHYIDGDSEWVQGHALCSHSHSHDHEHDHDESKAA